ncbi:dTMP kinase [Mesoterricola silvestris]|uniref:Thymidylate kinase n=1 Tax=Mesoterricola silvestris TaxID=2927979 RepID=A0AA48K7J3_9BACT|nr:dTMP kinase [Mesoterricola silvestris]BDU71181.1 thymidylate kinase [Mesoterricola silvestris]
MAGLFITMEGIEGSGKSTQLRKLAARLEGCGIPVDVSKEPGGTPLCRELRQLLLEPHGSGEAWCPKAELLLFYADRAQHLTQFIQPALEKGHLVLLDRFDDSTRAYQGAQGISDSMVDRIGEVVLGRLKPNLTLLLDMDPAVSLARVEARNAAASGFRETRFDSEQLEFHRRVRSRFLAIAQKEPQRVVVIPAQDAPEVVEEAIWKSLAPLLRTAGLKVE